MSDNQGVPSNSSATESAVAVSSATASAATAGSATAPPTNAVALTAEPVVRAPATVLNDADIAAYKSLKDGAVMFDLAPRHISEFVGEKAADALNGLVTNDTLPLAVGKGLYAAALTPKGKMLADVSILRTAPDTFLVESSEAAGREWFAMVRKYVNPRLAKYKDQSTAYATLGLYGPNAADLLARLGTGGMGDQEITEAMAQGLRAWPNWAHAPFVLSGTPVRLVRAPYLGGVAGFEILVPSDQRAEVEKKLLRVGALRGGSSLWQLLQLEGGLPVLGLDMDASTIPQEANLDEWSAISYEKGCYTGQETVARVHFRGHVNKHLRGLRSGALLEPGTQLFDSNGKAVGEVRRSAQSPGLGPVAIGLVRREVALGTEVFVGASGTSERAQVVSLPALGAAGWGTDTKQGAP